MKKIWKSWHIPRTGNHDIEFNRNMTNQKGEFKYCHATKRIFSGIIQSNSTAFLGSSQLTWIPAPFVREIVIKKIRLHNFLLFSPRNVFLNGLRVICKFQVVHFQNSVFPLLTKCSHIVYIYNQQIKDRTKAKNSNATNH